MKKLAIAAAMTAVAGAALAAPPVRPEPMPNINQYRAQYVRPIPEQTQTRDDVVAKVRKHFAAMDSNKDGFLAGDEMPKMGEMRMKRMAEGEAPGAMARHGPMGDPNAAFDRLDTNKDGSVSRDEFAKGREMRIERRVVMKDGKTVEDTTNGAPTPDGMKIHHRGMMRGGKMHGMMMKMADANNDGRVSLQEAQDSALKHFDMMDANHDGKLTPEERRQMHMKMREMHAPKAG